MDALSKIQKLQLMPPAIRKLVPNPNTNKVAFDSINDSNIENAVNYVKTNTLLGLLEPPVLSEQQPVCKQGPIILVFCQPSEQIDLGGKDVYPFVPISYCSWLQAAGARCIPLAYNLNEGSIQFLLQRAHGLLIPGGCSNLYKNYQSKEGLGPVTVGFLKVWRYIQKIWSRGIYFPIWGTCLGLQIMLIALSNDTKILSNLNSKSHQVEIYSDYSNSVILSKMPINLRLNLQNRKLLNFAHMHGISLKKFNNSPKLQEKLKIVSFSKDKDGKWFCSALQGKDRPIFLSQFHPEKQAFQWSQKGDILHNKYSIQISQYLALSFVRQCFKSKVEKTFISKAEQQFYLFQQFRQVYTPEKLYKVYAIDFKFRQYDRQKRKKTAEKQIGIASKKKIT